MNGLNRLLLKVEMEISEELRKNGRLNDAEEDIHSVVEQRLRAHAGDAALRLHTARSRNDQSATDTKLWMMDNLPSLINEIKKLIMVITSVQKCLSIYIKIATRQKLISKPFLQVLKDRAENEINIIIPGYTHLQRAQPIRWSHFLMR